MGQGRYPLDLAASPAAMRALCPHCKRTYKVPARCRGKKARCAKCGERFTVRDAPARLDPDPPPESAPPTAAESETRLRDWRFSMVTWIAVFLGGVLALHSSSSSA